MAVISSALLGELFGGTAVGQSVEQALRAADGVGTARAISAASVDRLGDGVLAEPRRQAEGHSLAAIDDPGRERQLLGDIGTNEPGQEQRAGHVGHQAPVDFADGQLGVGMDDADVGAEGDLQPAAEGVTVDGGDHRHG